MLRLVYVNPNPIPAPQETLDDPESSAIILSQKRPFREEVIASILPHFAAEVQFTGLSSYTMQARDISHYLSCPLTLEIQESSDESEFGNVICHFPVIQEQYLEAFLWEDDLLIHMIMMQFYLKILERLFTFWPPVKEAPIFGQVSLLFFSHWKFLNHIFITFLRIPN